MEWVLWFTISISPGHLGHFPVEGFYPSAKACIEDAERHWIPLLLTQFPNDPELAVTCKKWVPPGQRIV